MTKIIHQTQIDVHIKFLESVVFVKKNDELKQNQKPGRHSDKICAESFTENTPDIPQFILPICQNIWDMLEKNLIRRP